MLSIRRPAVPFILLALAAVVASTPSAAGAQEDAARPLHRALEALGDADRVQLFAPGVMVTDGTFVRFRNDSLTVADADALLAVHVDEIEGLSVERSRWRSVAIQAAGVGIVAGAMAGFVLGTARCGRQWEGCDAHAGSVALRWGAVFGVVGAVGGGLVGARMRGWHQVFP
jgi:hypothetical protein